MTDKKEDEHAEKNRLLHYSTLPEGTSEGDEYGYARTNNEN
jgi:hypothetical protein